MGKYRIYPCMMRTFFPLKKLRKLRCILYTESFVLDSRPSLACKQIHKCVRTKSFALNWKVKVRSNKEMMISIQLPILFRRTTDEQSYKIRRKASKNLKFGIGNVVAWGDEAPACLWHLWSSCDWKCESSIRKFSSYSSQIYLSSLTLSVPWVVEELDAVDSERYPWFYSGWPPKESIGRIDRFVAGASSDIIFWRDDPIVVFRVFPNHDVFTLFFVTTSSVFCFPFFFSKCSPK